MYFTGEKSLLYKLDVVSLTDAYLQLDVAAEALSYKAVILTN
jgi:hypothetical protein